MATAVATMMATTMATGMAATVAATAIATVAAAAMAERHHLAVTADEGDTNDREKHRQSNNNNSVHPRILQLLTGTVSENYLVAVTTTQSRQPTAQRRAATAIAIFCVLRPRSGPCCQNLRVTKDMRVAKVRS
jgi:hypothetical protein